MAKHLSLILVLGGVLLVATACSEDDGVLGPDAQAASGTFIDGVGDGALNDSPAEDRSVEAPVSEAEPTERPPAEQPAYFWPTETPIPEPTEPPTATPDPLADAGVPVRLEIPAIGVDASVEEVGLTAPPEQAMDVPKGWMNAGWYMLGARPGDVGNAVIAGHLDTSTGGPAVFWDLNKLVPGDEVIVTYERGGRFTFVVQGQQLYDHDADGPVIDQVFGPSQTRDLNLITCDGAWDHGQATYTQRLVVFTELDPQRSTMTTDYSSKGLN